MKRSKFFTVGILLGWAAGLSMPVDGLGTSVLAQSSESKGSSESDARNATPAPTVREGASVSPVKSSTSDAAVKVLTPGSGEWLQEYSQLNELIQRYDENVTSFRKDVQNIINQKYREELDRIQGTYDSMYKKLDDEARIRREQAIAAFERFIQKYPESEHTPLAMSRLAELYYDQASYDFLVAQQNWEQLTRGMENSKAFPEEPKYDFAKSMALYDRIIKEFPAFKYIDEVYYMRGYLLGKELAVQYNADGAKDAWFELIKRRPDSVYASQAYLRIGDYFFEKGSGEDLKTALTYYQRVMSYQDKLYDRALYKLAWAYYRLGDFDNAIARFVDLIDFSKAKMDETGKESDLRTEGVEYLAISLADHPKWTVNDVLALFKKIGERPYKLEVLKKLADVYYKEANYEAAIETYGVLQTLDPYNEDNPVFQNKIVSIYQSGTTGAGPEEALKAKEVLIKRYSPGSDWDQHQPNRAAVTKAQEYAQTALQSLAFYYHKQADDAKSDADKLKYFGIAAEKYREYLNRFPYSPNAYELQFYFAECLFLSGKFEEAAVQYERAMTSTDPKYHADAARGRVDSYQELVAREGEQGYLKPFPAPEPKPQPEEKPKVEGEVAEKAEPEIPQPMVLSHLKTRLVQAIDVLARIAPEKPETPNYLFIAAQMNYFHHQYGESQHRYQELIDQYPSNKLAVAAAANIVDGLIAQLKWEEVIDAIDKLSALTLGNEAKEWSKVRTQLADLRKKAQIKFGEVTLDKDPLIAIGIFENEGSDIGLYKAAKALERLGKVDRAIEDYQRLAREYPKSKYVEGALWQIASNYEKFFDLPRAIENYERLANNYPKGENAANSIYNAAFLRIGLHQYKEAARAYERYSLNFPGQPDAEQLMFFAGVNYQKADDYSEAVRAFRDYMKRYNSPPHGDRTMEAQSNIITGLEKLGRGKEALVEEKKVPALVASLKDQPTFTGHGVNLYAAIAFKDLQRTLVVFQDVKLTGNLKAQKAGLERKLQLLSDIEVKMKDIIKIQDVEWSTAALYSMGLACQGFAEALVEAVPKELSGPDLDDFLEILEREYTGPLEARALTYYERNVEIETKQKLWNKWIEQTYVQLNRLRPEKYPARKKESYQFIPGDQDFSAPPIKTLPMSNASARNEG